MIGRLRDMYDNGSPSFRNAAAAAARLVPADMRFGPEYGSTLKLLRTTEFATEEEIAAAALQRLRSLLELAEYRVPYYRELFKRTGFSSQQVRSLEDIQRLPLLTRDIVKEQGLSLVPEGMSPSAYRYGTTGGTSSGIPLGFYVSHRASAKEWAFINCAWSRTGYRPSDWRAVFRGRTVKGRESGRLWETDPLTRAVYFSVYDMTTENLARYVDVIEKMNIKYIHAFPSSATNLVRYLKSSGRQLPLLRAWLISSENMPDAQRDYIESIGARVFSWYGHSEKCVLATECECEKYLHPFPQYGITELTTESGTAVVDEGVRGRITGTSFINDATVFIRYVTDDTAEWVRSQCSCGRRGPRLRNVQGRSGTESLLGSHGTEISLASLNLHDSAFDEVNRFRLVQNEVGKALLLVVPRDSAGEDRGRRFFEIIAAKLAGEVDVGMKLVDELPTTSTGKFCYIERRIGESTVQAGDTAPERESS